MQLEEGQEITVNIPFTYTIGTKSYHTDKVIETISDCFEEVRNEIDEGILAEHGVMATITMDHDYVITEEI